MKYIIAIIQPDRLDEVVAALEEEEIILVTVSEVMGRGRQKGMAEVYRSHVERNGLLHKVKIEVAVSDNDVWKAVDAIAAGRSHRQHRGRQDLRPRHAGVPAHPHRRDGSRGSQVAHSGGHRPRSMERSGSRAAENGPATPVV